MMAFHRQPLLAHGNSWEFMGITVQHFSVLSNVSNKSNIADCVHSHSACHNHQERKVGQLPVQCYWKLLHKIIHMEGMSYCISASASLPHGTSSEGLQTTVILKMSAENANYISNSQKLGAGGNDLMVVTKWRAVLHHWTMRGCPTFSRLYKEHSFSLNSYISLLNDSDHKLMGQEMEEV